MSKSRGYIDIAAVKAATNLEQVLRHYNILQTLKPSGGSLRGCCPIHKGSNPDQFSVTLAKNMWKCFSECQHGGNHLDFVMKMEGCNSQEAAWLLNDWFNLGQESKAADCRPSSRQARPNEGAKTAPRQQKVPVEQERKTDSKPQEATSDEETGVNEPLSFTLDNLDASHPYLQERGLAPETVAHFGIGYCAKGIMAGRIAIPIHNAEGQLVANAGRWPGDPPEGKEKYRVPGKFKKTLEVYNLHRAAQEPDTVPLVIVEGFFPVMHLWQLGVRRVVALMGWFLSGRQEELIAKLLSPDSRIVLMLDNDEAGNAAQHKIAPRLAEHCFVRSFRWPEGAAQPDELHAGHLANVLT